MKFRPLNDSVGVRRADGDVKSRGGFSIPDFAKRQPHHGAVISAGPGSRHGTDERVQLDLRAGNLVLVGKRSGTAVVIDDEDLLILGKTDIMGIVAKKEPAGCTLGR